MNDHEIVETLRSRLDAYKMRPRKPTTAECKLYDIVYGKYLHRFEGFSAKLVCKDLATDAVHEAIGSDAGIMVLDSDFFVGLLAEESIKEPDPP